MYESWKDGELLFMARLVESQGSNGVPRAAVAQYLRTQAVAWGADLHQRRVMHTTPRLDYVLTVAAYLIETADAPQYTGSAVARWAEAADLLFGLAEEVG